MIVEPASLGPRSRPRRTLRAIALAVPVLLLVAVVGVGLMGPEPEDVREPQPTAAAVAVADPSAPGPDPVVGAGPMVQFPTRAAGLEVHGVRSTLEARDRGLVRGGVVAVAGYLALDEQPSDCIGGGLGIAVPFCERTGVLAEDPWSGVTTTGRGLPPFHLHPQIPSGVRVPYLAASAASLGRPAQPVVVLARFDDPRAAPCVPGGRHCGQELVVERVVWIDGEDFPRVVTIDPGLRIDTDGGRIRGQADWAVSTLPPEGYPLLAVLVRTDTLATLDPDAAASVPTDARDGVWYVRGLSHVGDPDQVDWLVLDAIDQRILARGAIATGPSGAPDTP